jgi:bifunctional non-homologous end joining protein LigD
MWPASAFRIPNGSSFRHWGRPSSTWRATYEAIAPWLLPHLADRPLTMVRCPNGVAADAAKRGPDCFYMKHSNVWAVPKGIRRVRIREKTKIGDYVIADSLTAVIGWCR